MTLDDVMREWFLGNEDAVRFCSELYDAFQEWDDLEDEGRCRHNELLVWLTFTKEYNPFFRAHADILRPVVMSAILQWRAANVLDHEPAHIDKAYMLRAGIYGVFHMVAFLVGGYSYADRVGPEIWRMYSETLAELREEMQCPVPL